MQEESNHQCPNDNTYMLWPANIDSLAFVLLCPLCKQLWEIDLGYDPDTSEELFYIYPFKA